MGWAVPLSPPMERRAGGPRLASPAVLFQGWPGCCPGSGRRPECPSGCELGFPRKEVEPCSLHLWSGVCICEVTRVPVAQAVALGCIRLQIQALLPVGWSLWARSHALGVSSRGR